jgi:hypothetical protein
MLFLNDEWLNKIGPAVTQPHSASNDGVLAMLGEL